jgi:hypothetical protein
MRAGLLLTLEVVLLPLFHYAPARGASTSPLIFKVMLLPLSVS